MKHFLLLFFSLVCTVMLSAQPTNEVTKKEQPASKKVPQGAQSAIIKQGSTIKGQQNTATEAQPAVNPTITPGATDELTTNQKLQAYHRRKVVSPTAKQPMTNSPEVTMMAIRSKITYLQNMAQDKETAQEIAKLEAALATLQSKQ